MASTAITMFEHIISITLWSNIDTLNNFMQLYVIMDAFFTDLIDFNVIIVQILKILSDFSSSYITDNQIYSLTNSNICNNGYENDDQEFIDQVSESVITDNGSGMIKAGSDESTKSFMLPNVVICKVTNDAEHLTRINNLNDYLQFYTDLLTMYFELLIERNKTRYLNEMTAIWEHLLSDTMEKETIVTNQLILPAHPVAIKEYNVQTSNTAFANCYCGDKMKYDPEATLTETSFKQYGITARGHEQRIECSKNTDVTYHTLFENTTENATNSAQYHTIGMRLLLVSICVFFCY